MKKLAQIFRSTWQIFKYLLLAVFFISLLTLILLSTAYRDLSSAAKNGLAAQNQLKAATSDIQAHQFILAKSKAQVAQTQLIQALTDLDRGQSKFFINHLPPLRQQIEDLKYLLKTAEIISHSLERALTIVIDLENIQTGATGQNFGQLSPQNKQLFLQKIYESEPELNGLKANLALAVLNLDKIHQLGVLWPIYQEISNLKVELQQATKLMETIGPIVKLLPIIAAYPQERNYLIIFQNNDELRPSGGFIGSYGLLQVHNGEITELTSHDSYHLDMPASLTDEWNLTAPATLQKYLGVKKWYLRDANWSPDWPTSARQIDTIYQGISRATDKPEIKFDGIIAINPGLVSDLINLVGTLSVDGQDYSANNFQELLQYNVEMAYKEKEISSWDRKNIINDLISELKNKLSGLSVNQWPQLLKIIQANIYNKNIQVYFSDPTWQAKAHELKASGEVLNDINHDYLMITDSNLAAFKSDAVVKKNFIYSVTENNNSLTATLKLNYDHQGDFDWRTTRYRSYSRIYVPRGTKLIKIDGLNESQADINLIDDEKLNKTIISFFFSVEPGQDRSITVYYQLPETIKQQFSAGAYRLLVQKQSGQRVSGLRVGFTAINGLKNDWSSDFITDKYFWFSGSND